MAQAPQRPNIVLIISDDQGWTDYGFMGHDTIQTPNLDRLATQGDVSTRVRAHGPLPALVDDPGLRVLRAPAPHHGQRSGGRLGRMKHPPTAPAPQLFKLKADSRESRNLAGEDPQRVEHLSKIIDGWWPLTERKQGVAEF